MNGIEPHSRRPRTVLRAFAMASGGGLLAWRYHAAWSYAVLGALLAGLLLALVLPRAYAPVERGLDLVQAGFLRAFSWIVLGIAFIFIFIPGRFLLARRGRARILSSGKANTYWEVSPPGDPQNFQRQF